MKIHIAILFSVLFAAATLKAERLLDSVSNPEQVMQNVLRKHGIETKIVKTYSSMKKKSEREDGGFLIELDGSPPIKLILNEDYWALATVGPNISYMLNPQDEQSALNISIGEGFYSRSDDDLRKDPGFTKITKKKGKINNREITWRRWSDANHLYSDCTVYLPIQGTKEDEALKVNIIITANTEARRLSLQEAMNTLKLLPN